MFCLCVVLSYLALRLYLCCELAPQRAVDEANQCVIFSPLSCAVWQHLATALTQAAAAVSTRARELHNLQRQRQPLLPRTLREMRRLREQPQDGSTPTQQRWQQLQQLGEAAHLERQQLERALAVYRQCCTVLEVGW